MASNVCHPFVTIAVVAATLLAVQPAGAQTTPDAGGANITKNRRAGTISDSDLRDAAASMDEGRAALKRNNFPDAIKLFKKVLDYPENQYSAEAIELLGFAYQKSGRLAEARAAYEECLRRYPSGERSERVKQRLAGVTTAQGDTMAPLRGPAEMPVKSLPVGRFTRTNETNWNLVASISSFYIRSDAETTARDTSLAPDVAASVDDHSVHQNEIFTSLDLLATWNNDSTSGRIRFNGGEEHRFATNINAPTGDQRDQIGVAQASVDMVEKDWNLRAIAGRQTYNGDGVFGRFDGALLSWSAFPLLKFDVVAGSPANSRYNEPFTAERYFYGGGIGLGPLFGGWDASIYYNEERGRWLVDREAVGTDIHYSDPTKFAFGNVDYDLRFQQLNEAVLSGSWTLPIGTTIYGGADYRRVPFLSSWNVLLNQPFATLYDFLKNQIALDQPLTNEQVEQLALAQTPLYRSAMIGFSQPLTDKLEFSADATIANLSRTITPNGLLDPSLAALAAGNEYYATVQLISTNIFKDGDMYIGAFHFAQQESSNQYVLDFNTRYPIFSNLRVAPRVRLGYNVESGIDLTQYTVMPSFLVDYDWDSHLTFEAEIGTQWTYGVEPGIKTSDTELFATIGFRYTFDVDGAKPANHSNPLTPAAAAICRYTVRPDGSCTTPSSVRPQ
ncbi:MAG: tetratricopeptide repeat protein [Bradyrhizobiaceae bacterium]|nr:tetratricopeptide repeat protein [Bradyrhizobiaceae bacterium]